MLIISSIAKNVKRFLRPIATLVYLEAYHRPIGQKAKRRSVSLGRVLGSFVDDPIRQIGFPPMPLQRWGQLSLSFRCHAGHTARKWTSRQ